MYNVTVWFKQFQYIKKTPVMWVSMDFRFSISVIVRSDQICRDYSYYIRQHENGFRRLFYNKSINNQIVY